MFAYKVQRMRSVDAASLFTRHTWTEKKVRSNDKLQTKMTNAAIKNLLRLWCLIMVQ